MPGVDPWQAPHLFAPVFGLRCARQWRSFVALLRDPANPTFGPLHSGLRTGSYREQGQKWPEVRVAGAKPSGRSSRARRVSPTPEATSRTAHGVIGTAPGLPLGWMGQLLPPSVMSALGVEAVLAQQQQVNSPADGLAGGLVLGAICLNMVVFNRRLVRLR
jgi:hypothetical protein